MDNNQEISGRLEWKITVPDGTSKILEPKTDLTASSTWRKLQSVIVGLVMNIRRFLVNSWDIGVAEPKKFIHCIKVGLALSLVSLFYYLRPLYDSVGGNAMWAIMTVVVVFEYTVGATISKSLNRATATSLAGLLGVGVHWIAGQCGQEYEPLVVGVSVFIFASAATFTRFIPSVKARFDYGAMIFILTFSFVSVSGYRVDNKLIILARNRVTTIAIGTSLCICISMLFRPVWAGSQLHYQIINNLEKLANSLEGYVNEYFSDGETTNITGEESTKKLQGYKCVLNSKASEESMANFARWEPAHGHFYFGYPWEQYVKIGAAVRNCAYCIDNLSSCIDSEMQAPEFLKNFIKDQCTKLSFYASKALKELAVSIRTRRKSFSIDISVDEMNIAVRDLHITLESLPYQFILPAPTIEEADGENGGKIETPNQASILEVLPLGTLAILLIETTARIEEIVLAVDKLASTAGFKTHDKKQAGENQPIESTVTNCQDQEPIQTCGKV